MPTLSDTPVLRGAPILSVLVLEMETNPAHLIFDTDLVKTDASCLEMRNCFPRKRYSVSC